MTFFETHMHVYPEDDLPALLHAAQMQHVEYFVLVAGNLGESAVAVELARQHQQVYSTVGVHPHEAAAYAGDIASFRQLARQPEVIAVGEIGLDYYYDHSPRSQQRHVFVEFLHLAAELQLPAIVHCRDAYEDCLAILHSELCPGQSFLIHSVTGPVQWVAELMDMGGFFSFNGMVTFKKADNIRAILAAVPVDRIVLETDSPYLAPVPFRGKRNQPAYIPQIAERIAAEKSLGLEEMARVTTANAMRFFHISAG